MTAVSSAGSADDPQFPAGDVVDVSPVGFDVRLSTPSTCVLVSE
jgi:hypothetical protein